MDRIKVLIADGYFFLREGVKSYLDRLGEVEVVGEAATGQEAIDQALKKRPEVVLMAIALPEMDGVEATRRIKKALPEVKVLAFTSSAEKKKFTAMIRAGASGYVLKDAPPQELAQAIHQVHMGQTYISSQIARMLAHDYVAGCQNEKAEVKPDLTPREEEVLALIARGLSNKEIAGRLFISVRTVETHRERIMRKLGIRSAAGLTRFAIHKGLLSMDD